MIDSPATAPPRRRVWKRALLAAEFLAVYVAIRLAAVGGAGAFPGAGNVYVGPGHPGELKILPNKGYDGQFVYRLAIEPFTTQLTGHGISFDSPAYRQQRIMTALLARIVSDCPGISTAVALIIVNCAAVVVAVVAGMAIADDLGARRGLGILLGLPAGVVAGFVADLTEPVSWAGVLVAILAVRRGRWLAASAAFGVAMLARETTALVVFGYLCEAAVVLLRDRSREQVRRLWLLLPIAVESAWQLWLWHVWGNLPAITGLRSVGVRESFTASPNEIAHHASGHLPFVGIEQTFLDGLVTGDTGDVLLGVSYLVERIALVALIVGAGWALAARRARPGIALTVAWCSAAILALAMTSWKDDIQFLRAAVEVWGLSILVLMSVNVRWARWLLAVVAAVTAWVAIYFLPRI